MTGAKDDVAYTASELGRILSAAVVDAYVAYTTEKQKARDDLLALTMSGLGGCTRQAAYRLARTEPTEKLVFGPMREANIGTMIHEAMLPTMAMLLGGTEEIAVQLTAGELSIAGRSDLYVEPLATVADLKTVGGYKFGGLSETVNRSHKLQVAGYALAVRQAKKPVDWIAWIYMDRSSGAEHVIVEPFTDDTVALVEDRCAELSMYAKDPEAAPRDERGPGLSYVCDGCPWLRACWGDDAEPGVIGAQKILARDHDGVSRALALYDDARVRERDASADKEFAKAMFTGYDAGNYGEWSFGWSNAGETEDKDAAVELLRQAGIPVPRKRTTKRLYVKRTKQ